MPGKYFKYIISVFRLLKSLMVTRSGSSALLPAYTCEYFLPVLNNCLYFHLCTVVCQYILISDPYFIPNLKNFPCQHQLDKADNDVAIPVFQKVQWFILFFFITVRCSYSFPQFHGLRFLVNSVRQQQFSNSLSILMLKKNCF